MVNPFHFLRVYTPAVILGYKRCRERQHPNRTLLEIIGCKTNMWIIKYNFSTSVLILGAIAYSSLGNCSPVFDDAVVSSQKSYKDDFIVDSIIPNDFSSGEARIFGNFSFGNSSILTVAGFVIVGIILFGKFLN